MSDIQITSGELRDPRIDELLALERSLARSEGVAVESVKTPFYLNPVFYYSVAAVIAAFLVWCVIEPFASADERGRGHDILPLVANYVFFGPAAGMIGLAVGLTYGIANRNWKQALYAAMVGLGVGLGISLFTSLAAGFLYGLASQFAVQIEFSGRPPIGERILTLHGVAFVLQMCGRGIAWAIISMGAGLGLGIALKSKKLSLNGLAGGMVGGMLGGLMFDPVSRFVCGSAPVATLSRAIGFSSVGLLVGLFIGFFENISKDAWFQMIRGPLAGKQFSLFKTPMVIGSAPKCDIYLFKDPAIEPCHALVAKSGNRYTLTDQQTPAGVLVNGRPAKRHVLQDGDMVALGATVLRYHERQKGQRG